MLTALQWKSNISSAKVIKIPRYYPGFNIKGLCLRYSIVPISSKEVKTFENYTVKLCLH